MSELTGTMSFCELRSKEVINILDGRRLGRIIDVVFSGCNRAMVKGIVVPFIKRFFFFRDKEIFVPWHCIKKIGEDVILVELVLEGHDSRPRRRRRYEGFDFEHGGHRHAGGEHGGGHGGHGGEHGGEHREGHGHKSSSDKEIYNKEVHSYADTVNKKTKSKNAKPRFSDLEEDDDDDIEESEEIKTRYNRPHFDINKKAPPKKKSIRDTRSQEKPCDKKCEKCMLFDCENRWA